MSDNEPKDENKQQEQTMSENTLFDLDHDESDDELGLDEDEANADAELLQLQLTVQERDRETQESSHQKNAQRRAALATKRREIESLKQKLGKTPESKPVSSCAQPIPFHNASPDSNPFDRHRTSAQPASSSRALDFGTPYTNAGPDMYGRAVAHQVKKPARRQTLAVVDQVDEEDDMCIRVPMPERFDGTGLVVTSNDPAESVQVRMALLLDSIVDYIEYQCDSKGVVLSERQFVKVASRFLTGTAAGVYKDLKLMAQQEAARLGHSVPALVTWPELRKALEMRFGRPQPGHQLIRCMSKLKQKANESVESYTVRFDALHMELTRQNLATRDLSIALYLDGLVPALQERVEEIVNSIDYCERENIGPHEARKAILSLQRLAAAREAHVNAAARQANQQKPSSNQQPSASNMQQSNGSANGGATGSRPVNVPDALYAQRVAAGLCGKCNSADHISKECKRPRNLDPVPKRPGGRANVMMADQANNASTPEPKN